jgi:ABC-type polysaccharide/polyol phosphate transport system ATPase subunit
MQALIQRTRILVLASHSDALITSMCNRAILLEKGHLVEIGPVDEVIKRYHQSPAEAFVA